MGQIARGVASSFRGRRCEERHADRLAAAPGSLPAFELEHVGRPEPVLAGATAAFV
jgi:hypothetical protein